ncbi:metallophosphoesterase [Paraburkholderia sp. GAS33]|uniref:metallophosphoesterase n=1 Tax=Paraburkholderia sp. GAS33 TaxID=3035130 RepID=UPI003D23A483
MRHPDRTAIFVGDFIDRGPAQLETLNIVRPMVESGSALGVMGNHECRCLVLARSRSWRRVSTPPQRRRWAKNRRQHVAFLEEFERNPNLHAEIINWLQRGKWRPTRGVSVERGSRAVSE